MGTELKLWFKQCCNNVTSVLHQSRCESYSNLGQNVKNFKEETKAKMLEQSLHYCQRFLRTHSVMRNN